MMNIKNKLPTRAADPIACLIHPLKKLCVNDFFHDITFEKGQISMLSNRADFFEYYYKNQIPVVCTNDQGRMLPPGIYLDCKLKRDYADYSSAFLKVSKQFNIKNFLHLIEVEQDCQHMYSFSFDLDEIDFLHLVTNNIRNITNFISHYKLQANEIITQAKLPKNRIILPINRSNMNLNGHPRPLSEILKTDQPIVSTLNQAFQFTNRQRDCANLLLDGCTIKEIAEALHLSPRTVETHLNKLKIKLQCKTKRDLRVKLKSHHNKLLTE